MSEGAKKYSKYVKVLGAVLVIVASMGIGFMAGKQSGIGSPATSKNYLNSKTYATVGDTKITGKELEQRMNIMFYLNKDTKMTDDEIIHGELSNLEYMATTEALYQEAKKNKITVTEEEVTAQYDSIMGQLSQMLSMTNEEIISKFKLTEEQIRNDLEKESIASKYLQEKSVVSDKEAEEKYNKNKEEYLNVQASHILLKTTDEEGNAVDDGKKSEIKKEAEDILKKAKSGEDFAKLAKEYSEDTSASNGGDLGFFTTGQMVAEFEEAAFKCKKGEVYGEVVETQYGYHIIKKTDEKHESFEDIKDNIKQELAYTKQSELLEKLKEEYKVDIKVKDTEHDEENK